MRIPNMENNAKAKESDMDALMDSLNDVAQIHVCDRLVLVQKIRFGNDSRSVCSSCCFPLVLAKDTG